MASNNLASQLPVDRRMQTPEKICIGCHRRLPIDFFHRDKRGARRGRCADCTNALARDRHASHRERTAAQRRVRYRLRHAQRIAWEQQHYRENRTRIIAVQEAWIDRNLERYAGACMQRSARRRAKVQNIPYELPLRFVEALLIEQQCRCVYCGCSLNICGRLSKSERQNRPSLDRVFRGDGYIVGNVVVACLRCNIAKGSGGLEDFERFIKVMRTILDQRTAALVKDKAA
jgi:hypothetical protein